MSTESGNTSAHTSLRCPRRDFLARIATLGVGALGAPMSPGVSRGAGEFLGALDRLS